MEEIVSVITEDGVSLNSGKHTRPSFIKRIWYAMKIKRDYLLRPVMSKDSVEEIK